MKKRDYQCLLVETPDGRQFFTQERNYSQLVEFANTFNATISMVHVEEAEILDLIPLAAAISDPEYRQQVNYKVLETKLEPPKPIIKRDREQAKEIRGYISDMFNAGQVVSLNQIAEKFAQANLSRSTLCNMISKTRKELTGMGYNIVKIGAGKYKIEKKP